MKFIKGLLNSKVKRISAAWIALFIFALMLNFKLVALVLAMYFFIWLKLIKAYRGVL